jgi:thioredoxin 1
MRQTPNRWVTGAMVLWCVSGIALLAQTPAPASAVKSYYPASDANADIAAAAKAGKADGKYVLIDFGADWCPDCRVLGTLMDSDTVAPFVAANFHVVHVDVGRRDKNMDLAAKLQATAGDWIPAVVVMDGDAKILAVSDRGTKLTRRMTAADLLSTIQGWAPKKTWRPLATFTEHGVSVSLTLYKDSSGRVWLAANYSPSDSRAHLYSKDLPAAGLQDMGRPTSLALVEPSVVKATGPAVADRPVIQDKIDVLNLSFPIYPDGPVTLRLPIAWPPASTVPVALSIGYMVCGPNGCLPPVEKQLTVALTK